VILLRSIQRRRRFDGSNAMSRVADYRLFQSLRKLSAAFIQFVLLANSTLRVTKRNICTLAVADRRHIVRVVQGCGDVAILAGSSG